MKFQCQICDREFLTILGLSNHISRGEKVSVKEYYEKFPIPDHLLHQHLKREVLKRIVHKDNGCIEWTGHKCQGYGGYHGYRGNKSTAAHRLVYELFVGKIPEDKMVCHHCDNSLCVNLTHLYIGTHQENMNDMKERNRSLKGDKNPSKREDVREKIRRTYICTKPDGTEVKTDDLREFCTKYNLKYRTMCEAGGGKGWKCRRENELQRV